MRKPTILCVEDKPNGLTGRESLLRERGYDVLTATSGRECLDLLEEASVDGVILGCDVQEMMGDRVAERMKQLRPDVPIMMLSTQECVPPTARYTADSFLPDNVPPNQFVDAVHDMVAAGSPFFHRWLHNWKRRLSA